MLGGINKRGEVRDMSYVNHIFFFLFTLSWMHNIPEQDALFKWSFFYNKQNHGSSAWLCLLCMR
jgi:hypothetical protein